MKNILKLIFLTNFLVFCMAFTPAFSTVTFTIVGPFTDLELGGSYSGSSLICTDYLDLANGNRPSHYF